MVDTILLVFVLIILIFAVKGSVKHFKGEGGCCGGGGKGISRNQTKTLQNPKIGEKTVRISGMHCQNCAEHVTRSINKIDGATAEVNLKKAEAIISYDRSISDEDIRKAVKKAGYQVTEILNL